MTDAAHVLSFLNGPDCSLPAAVAADTSLIRSRLLDSLALFELSLWVEAQIGRPLDPAALDIAAEWETPAGIARFIADRQGAGAHPTEIVSPAIAKSAGTEAGYAIVRYAPHHNAALSRLHRLLITSDDPTMSAAHLNWKYGQNPYSRDWSLYLALSGEEVVAARGTFAQCWETDRGAIVVPAVSDLAIALEHRNRGLHSRIMQKLMSDLRAAGHTHLISLSAAPVTSLASLAMGFRVVSPVDQRLLKPPASARLWRRVRRAVGGDPTALDGWAANGVLGDGLFAERTVRTGAMVDLIARLGHDGRLRIRRDARYLDWRYRKPGLTYSFIYSGGERLDGYVVLAGVSASPRTPVRIADWEATTPAVAARLFDAAIRQCRPRNLIVWEYGLDGDRKRLLAERGFFNDEVTGARGFQRCVLVKALTEDPTVAAELGGRAVFDAASWDYRMIYSDIA